MSGVEDGSRNDKGILLTGPYFALIFDLLLRNENINKYGNFPPPDRGDTKNRLESCRSRSAENKGTDITLRRKLKIGPGDYIFGWASF